MIMTSEGGIKNSRLPAPASEPMERLMSYLRRVSSVVVILPIGPDE